MWVEGAPTRGWQTQELRNIQRATKKEDFHSALRMSLLEMKRHKKRVLREEKKGGDFYLSVLGDEHFCIVSMTNSGFGCCFLPT